MPTTGAKVHPQCLRLPSLFVIQINTSPSNTTCGPAGIQSKKTKLTTSHKSVCWRPRVMTHSPPPSTVVDLQTTTCVGAASGSTLHQPQVPRSWSCGQQCPELCSYTSTSFGFEAAAWYVKYTKVLHQCGIMVENMLHIQVDFAGVFSMKNSTCTV